MQPLDKTLRSQLEHTIKQARDIAENAALSALEQLGVGDAMPPTYLNKQELNLRRKLRIHGRQLGDMRDSATKIQEIELLTEEVAYEHWHRMLFARFLAENNLLMYPDSDNPIAITLGECEEIASDEGAVNGWELAARFATHMLPQIFRLDSPVFKLVLAPEHQQKLEMLVTNLALEVFTASDSLGWVYQFWQVKKKDAVNASEVKIGARELPAVTQLFTEPYMVSFLLDNSLGAWWAARQLSEADFRDAISEEALRSKAAISGVPLEYLRFVQQEDSSWTLAAGAFEGWPKHFKDLKILDPCCGSGHFLVAVFLMLVPMRMKEEKISEIDAIDAVLRENIHGLELDKRCVELAVFALAITAWKYPNAGGYRILPELNVACSGLSLSAKKDEWLALAGDNINLRFALDGLYNQFKDAPTLGSLINLESSLKNTPIYGLKWKDIEPLLNKALVGEKDDEITEMGVIAKGMTHVASILSNKYNLVATNVPYLTHRKQADKLRDYCTKNYPEAKNDLATVFLQRCLSLCAVGGTASIVLPQNWLFLSTYKKFREQLLKKDVWHLIARLGSKAFDTISGEVVKAILLTISHGNESQYGGGLFEQVKKSHFLHGLDVSEAKTTITKAIDLQKQEITTIEQAQQLGNPDARISFESIQGRLLADYAYSYQGISTGDNLKYRRKFWEIFNVSSDYQYFQSTVEITKHISGCESIVCYELMTNPIQPGVYLRAKNALGKQGIMLSQMGQLPSTIYLGSTFDTNAAAIIPNKPMYLPAIWCFCASSEYNEAVRQIDQKLNVTNATLVKVPFDLEYWSNIAKEKYPNGLPKPYSNDPTQWIFHGHPCGAVIWDNESKWTAQGSLRNDSTVLQVAVARLLGYRWPAELDADMELADEQRIWVEKSANLLPYADTDGIVCIPAVRGEAIAADRLLDLLATAYGDAWSNDVLAQLLSSVGHTGKTLDSWLQDKFFTQHCKLFQHRPFIWHIWDGLPDGFAALVNYHKLDTKLLETLIYTYLGDWISRQKQDIANSIDGAQDRLVAAEQLKKKLELIFEGEVPYDIFVRWKLLEKQPIGWNPDLNDGVRLNIRPFLSVPDVRKKDAGVLKDKPNINWKKDRGRDVESAPWYHKFDGDRINDYNLSLADKQNALENKNA